ncbi:peptidoglycan recognition protein family protein [Saccharopolyspora mangrovi]|uniref:N-acetylmuramoyl-L-alanine amidase n=1 Tax=Saccharopolyspora mangrovi TaxID=3082379 RepID=A0ABU6AL10_9PSEU|nr:N-acetylmuramoyl-L-alanine amidase [Saccharopolyspora sp. S2-29]MEB3372248.1 N-acetylmuramoyl-L-alanine amidase [Saccharopolyspora sp. S2-29]
MLQHHTATRTTPQNPAPTLNMCINGRPDLDGPLCQALIGLDGSIHLVAAGRANHAGEAKASGPMPAAGSGNDIYIGFEWDYQGVEQHPSREQYDAAVRATAAVLRHLRVPAEHTRGHKETTTTGKIDPGNVDLNQFRAHVAAAMNQPAPQPNPPGPAPQPQPPQGQPPLPPIPDSPPARGGNPGPPDPAVMRIIYLVGKHMKVSGYVMLAAFETGLVESQMSNLNWGHSTSLGVFQQRPEWWGTPQQLMDVRYAATKFFESALKKERENSRRSAGQLAQDVQDSAHPERYDQREAEARRLIDETARAVHAAPPGPNPPPHPGQPPNQGQPRIRASPESGPAPESGPGPEPGAAAAAAARSDTAACA